VCARPNSFGDRRPPASATRCTSPAFIVTEADPPRSRHLRSLPVLLSTACANRPDVRNRLNRLNRPGVRRPDGRPDDGRPEGRPDVLVTTKGVQYRLHLQLQPGSATGPQAPDCHSSLNLLLECQELLAPIRTPRYRRRRRRHLRHLRVL
jgi:hypothetical protein